ncbi:ATP-binding protein [Streptomyces sp. NPDC050439]|uniref:ATP-binding protein n=1 Tax=unclassified Streptomyces TaxID=2593676 RepID=UPI00344401C8
MTATRAAGEATPLRNMPARDVWAVCFSISPRNEDGPVPVQDAMRVSEMRRLVRARLEYCCLSALADDVTLLVSELVTNAIEHNHGRTDIALSLTLVDGRLHLEVQDGTSQPPKVQRPSEDAETGRGLLIVQAVTEARSGRWGSSPDGERTWCTIPVATGSEQ